MLKRRSFLLGLTAALLLVATSAGAGGGAESAVNSFMGTFETGVPIGVPGYFGLEPKLALQYRSLGGNGHAGVGWGLSGFSTIERSSPGGGAPRYDANDVYYLDGNLLLPCAQAASSPGCLAGGTHATRIESYARITYVSGSNTWEMTKRDGTKAVFGAVYMSTATFRWMVTSVADRAGNTVSYAYWCESGADCYPNTVTYNGVLVKLYWETRPDPIKFAVGPGLGTTNYRLKTVDVSVGGSRARAYKLTYAAAGTPPQSKLAAVQQFGRDATLDAGGTVTGGSALPAMTLGWDAAWPKDFVRSSGTQGWDFGWPPSTTYSLAEGDFNGDGKTDIDLLTPTNHWVMLSNGNGTFTVVQQSYPGWNFGTPPAKNYALAIGDFNGDGKTDIDLMGATNHHLMLSNGDGTFAYSAETYAYGWNFESPIANKYTLAVGDFNGDGKADIDLLGGPYHYLMLSNGNGTFSYSQLSHGGWDFGYPPGKSFTLAVGDFNGDGKVDIDFLGAVAHHLMLSNGNGTFANYYVSYGGWNLGSPPGLSYTLAVGDFNGDGKTDIDLLGATTHHLMLSNGTGSFTNSQPSYPGWNLGNPAVGSGPSTIPATYNPRFECTLTHNLYNDSATCSANCHGYYGCSLGGEAYIHYMINGMQASFDDYSGWWGYIDATNQNTPRHVCNYTDYLACYATQTTDPGAARLTTLELGAGTCGDYTPFFFNYHSCYIRQYTCPIEGYACNGSHVCDVGYGCADVSQYFYSCPNGYTLKDTTCYANPALVVGDFNGDGKADIDLVGATSHRLMLSNGEGNFTYAEPSHGGWDFGSPVGANYMVAPGDFDGDGKTDVTMLGGPYYYMSRAGAGSSRMVSLATGLGGSSTITYSPSSSWTGNQLPVGMVFPTVSAVTTSDGQGDNQTTTYNYTGARWQNPTAADPVGSFLGFRRATTTLASTGAYSETYYWQRVGTIAKPEVTYKRRPDGAIMAFDRLMFTENTAPPYTSLATEFWGYECNGDAVLDGNGNYVSGCRRMVTTYGYDQYGNMTVEQQYGDWDVGGDERTIARSFAPNTSAYVVGLPAWENVYAGIGTGGALLNATKFYYDGATSTATAPTAGMLTKKGVWNDQTGTDVVHQFTYDTAGRELTATGPVGGTVTRTYNSAGQVVSVADPLGRTTQTTWDPVLGVPLTTTDVNGQVTTNAYDAFGRGTLTTKPDGAQVKVEHLDWGTATQRSRTSTLLPGNQWVWEDAYFDGVGRPTKVVSSTGVTAETIYGANGKVWKQSLPYVSGETVRYDVHTYDDMGRPLTTTFPTGAVITRAYGDGWVSVTDPQGTVRASWYDAYGRLTLTREVIDGTNADTRFYYDLMGRRTKSLDALGNSTVVSYDSLGRVLQKADPDQGLWRYGYDLGGRMTSETDALNKKSTLGYDALGRVTRRTYADGSHDDYTFDEAGRGASLGRLTTAVSASGVTTRAWYDVAGRRTRYEQVVDGTTYAVSHAYDAAGRLTAETYPDGEVVTYTYGTSGLATGKLVGMSGSMAGSLVTGVTYTARGQVGSLTYANGVTQTATFDATGERVASLQIGSLATISYGYDLAGQITSQSSAQLKSTNWTYGYDSIGRLTRATNLNYGAYTSTYRYDAGGRMLCSSESGKGAYTYGDSAHAHAVTAAGANTYAYDANGNMTSGAGRLLSYDLAHRPASIASGGLVTDFVYDAQGVRVKKSSANGTVVYVGGLYEARGAQVVKHYLAGGLRVAKRDASGNRFVHADHLGSTRLLTNASGQEVQHYDYAPYGRLIADSAGAGDTRRFTGQESDDETGLIFYQARYYDPALGRFIQPDSFVPNANGPQDLDLYAYASNSPINYVDPSGHRSVARILIAVVLCVVAMICPPAGLTAMQAVGMIVVGTALTYTNVPVLQAIGMVMVAYAGAAVFGGPAISASGAPGTIAIGTLEVSAPALAAGVALATSPISPLDPTVKKIIGWAYTVAGFVANLDLMAAGAKPNGIASGIDNLRGYATGKGFTLSLGESLGKMLGNTTLGNGLALAASELGTTALGWAAAYATSSWGTGGKYAVAFLGRAFVMSTGGGSGPLAVIGATYDLAYTLRYPDGRTVDLSGGQGGESFTLYHHTGFESASFSFGRQHIRVGDPGGGFWEMGDAKIGHFGPGLGWGGWGATQKITVVLSPAQAASFRAALQAGSEGGGSYQGYHRDSYYYISAALQFATGTSAADLHINPGLIHW